MKKQFFLGLKFEWNLSVNTWRSGTDYCWLYCDFSSQTFIFLISLVICNFWINLIAISKVIQIRVYKCFSLLARYSRGNSLLAILFYSFWVHILPGPHFFCRGTTGSNPFWWSKLNINKILEKSTNFKISWKSYETYGNRNALSERF